LACRVAQRAPNPQPRPCFRLPRRPQGACCDPREGDCCFWTILCFLIPCCLPCVSPRFQRPVYGYPIQCQIIADAADGKGTAGSRSATPALALAEAGEGGGFGGGGGNEGGEHPAGSGGGSELGAPPAAATAEPQRVSLQLAVAPRASPSLSPRPQPIFVPPSAVPLIGFSQPSPGYPKYRAEPSPGATAGSAAGSGPGSAAGTPRSAFSATSHPARLGSPLMWAGHAPAAATDAAAQVGAKQQHGGAPASRDTAPAEMPPWQSPAPERQLEDWGSRQNSRQISIDSAAGVGTS
jgi:hypothetical protein